MNPLDPFSFCIKLKMESLLRDIKERVDEIYREKVEDIVYGILTDFKNECKDKKAVDTLSRIIDVWMDNDLDQMSPEHKKSSEPSPLMTSTDVQPPPTAAMALSDPPKEVKTEPTVPKAGTCQIPLKSGPRKGQPCGGPLKGNNQMCQKHLPRVVTGIKCEAIMKAGSRKGQQCGKPVGPGDLFCGTHKVTKCVWKEGKKKCGRPISKCSPSETFCRIHLPQEITIDKSKFVLFTNKFGSKEHRYSELIFEDKKVCGKQKADGGTLSVLSDDDYECVKVYGLPLADALVPGMLDYLRRRVDPASPQKPDQ